ncbi:putative Anti-sigma-B factor antagonist [metagenome]|uniref:Putative Anti-sigma-B factor antagonist n=1 Tax=metagenome TaxID=256318 RepID=A0A2P2CG13_9ZZZZ
MSGDLWASVPRRPVHVPTPRAADLRVRRYPAGHWCVVEAVGEIDLQGIPLLRQHLGDVPPHLLFDLSGVTFMDASGLGVLSLSLRAARLAGGSVRIAGASAQIRAMLASTGLDRVMATFPTVDDALV